MIILSDSEALTIRGGSEHPWDSDVIQIEDKSAEHPWDEADIDPWDEGLK